VLLQHIYSFVDSVLVTRPDIEHVVAPDDGTAAILQDDEMQLASVSAVSFDEMLHNR
jgi:hypothetical protein